MKWKFIKLRNKIPTNPQVKNLMSKNADKPLVFPWFERAIFFLFSFLEVATKHTFKSTSSIMKQKSTY